MGSQNWWFGDPRPLLYTFKPLYSRVQWFLGQCFFFAKVYPWCQTLDVQSYLLIGSVFDFWCMCIFGSSHTLSSGPPWFCQSLLLTKMLGCVTSKLSLRMTMFTTKWRAKRVVLLGGGGGDTNQRCHSPFWWFLGWNIFFNKHTDLEG